jgi:hypothetical protein
VKAVSRRGVQPREASEDNSSSISVGRTGARGIDTRAYGSGAPPRRGCCLAAESGRGPGGDESRAQQRSSRAKVQDAARAVKCG